MHPKKRFSIFWAIDGYSLSIMSFFSHTRRGLLRRVKGQLHFGTLQIGNLFPYECLVISVTEVTLINTNNQEMELGVLNQCDRRTTNTKEK